MTAGPVPTVSMMLYAFTKDGLRTANWTATLRAARRWPDTPSVWGRPPIERRYPFEAASYSQRTAYSEPGLPKEISTAGAARFLGSAALWGLSSLKAQGSTAGGPTNPWACAVAQRRPVFVKTL